VSKIAKTSAQCTYVFCRIKCGWMVLFGPDHKTRRVGPRQSVRHKLTQCSLPGNSVFGYPASTVASRKCLRDRGLKLLQDHLSSFKSVGGKVGRRSRFTRGWWWRQPYSNPVPPFIKRAFQGRFLQNGPRLPRFAQCKLRRRPSVQKLRGRRGYCLESL